MLLGQVQRADWHREAVGADQSEESDCEAGPDRPVERVLDLQAESQVLPRDPSADAREVVDNVTAGAAIRHHDLALPPGHAFGAEGGLGGFDELAVLEDLVGAGHRGEYLAGVLAAGPEESRLPVLGEERDALDFVFVRG